MLVLQPCLLYIFALFLQFLILIFCTLQVLLGNIQLKPVSYLSTEILALLVIILDSSILQTKTVPIPHMRWSPFCVDPFPNRMRSKCPSVPQQHNLHHQKSPAKVSTTVSFVFCFCSWGQKDFPVHVNFLLHNSVVYWHCPVECYVILCNIVVKFYQMSS